MIGTAAMLLEGESGRHAGCGHVGWERMRRIRTGGVLSAAFSAVPDAIRPGSRHDAPRSPARDGGTPRIPQGCCVTFVLPATLASPRAWRRGVELHRDGASVHGRT